MSNSIMTYVNDTAIVLSSSSIATGEVLQSAIMSNGAIICLTDNNELIVRKGGIESVLTFDCHVHGLKIEEGLLHPITIWIANGDKFTCHPDYVVAPH